MSEVEEGGQHALVQSSVQRDDCPEAKCRPTGPCVEAQVNPSKTVGSGRGSLGFPDWRT